MAPRNNFFRAIGAASARAPENNICRIFGAKIIIKNFILTAAIVFCLPVFGSAQTFVKPGDTGSIGFPIENDSESVALAEGAEITVNAPPYFIVKNTSILGPVSENPAQTRTFVIDYEIGQDAPDGSFSANLQFKTTTLPVDPDPDTVSSVVDFIPYAVVFLDVKGFPFLIHKLVAKPVNFRTAQISTRLHDTLLAKRYTASYARGVALCPLHIRTPGSPIPRSKQTVTAPRQTVHRNGSGPGCRRFWGSAAWSCAPASLGPGDRKNKEPERISFSGLYSPA